jgi:aspartate-semialdehyde dehydrogenase
MQNISVAIVGATGAVGGVLLDLLASRKFPLDNLYLVASERSKGKFLSYGKKSYEVIDIADFDFTQVSLCFFSAGSAVSKEYVPKAIVAGCCVIDNTSCFRYDDEVLLIVPEVNGHLLPDKLTPIVIANPNCSTIQMLVVLKPLYDAVGIKRIDVATYQAVSGAGNQAILALREETESFLHRGEITAKAFDRPIAFNVLPGIDTFQENGYTREEMKMVWETQKIFSDKALVVNPTCVRVPVMHGHSEAVHIQTREPLSADDARRLLSASAGVFVSDATTYPTPLEQGEGDDRVFVGRIRESLGDSCGVNCWVVSDNLRKGAALNAIQIAENMLK